MRYSHGNRRLSGVAVPLSAIRSDSSPGCGEFPDLIRFGDLASSCGLDLIQLLPLNDSGFQNSPYFALSAFALNPIYLKIGDLPELKIGNEIKKNKGDRPQGFREAADGLIHRFIDEKNVPYGDLLKEKLNLLRQIWDFTSEDNGNRSSQEVLNEWIAVNPWIKSYAAFVTLKSLYSGKPWWEWPRHRDPSSTEIEVLWNDCALVKELYFWAWIQMSAADQFHTAAKYLAEKGIALMGDIPILMNADSADVWSRRDCFDLELSAGAPPDMYSGLGQNWGFPVYNWEALERQGFGFWTERLIEADKYYSCFRIDHVLGFFRIWSLSERESTGSLGRFVPDIPIYREELETLGFSAERIRWMSRPHVPIWRLIQAAGESAAKAAAFAALERIGEEDLFLFKETIRGEKDIEALPSISPAARECLLAIWRDRALFEYAPGAFLPTWNYRSSTCWATLAESERSVLECLFRERRAQAEELWSSTGNRLLSVLLHAVPMLPCAEDLGSVPLCVPKVLEALGILGLRVLRWARLWDENKQPYLPIAEYPELSVACPSVHDSSSIREWWETEADRELTWRFASISLARELGPCPDRLSPDHVMVILELIARARSRFAVYPIQDILAMSERLRPSDPKQERINVPGTVGIGNWSYRIPATIDEILGEKKLAMKVRGLVKARSVAKKTG
jgi:4-alpha-glucanotransferase